MKDTKRYAVWLYPRSRSWRSPRVEKNCISSANIKAVIRLMMNSDNPRQYLNFLIFLWTDFLNSPSFGIMWHSKLGCFDSVQLNLDVKPMVEINEMSLTTVISSLTTCCWMPMASWRLLTLVCAKRGWVSATERRHSAARQSSSPLKCWRSRRTRVPLTGGVLVFSSLKCSLVRYRTPFPWLFITVFVVN